ncbi:hypothetical protein PROPHIGD43A-4_47 [Mycobacterium phage prophiGD43A-4]|nr:hypothetical protein PROPHIGD43A-4_47 [Mycobacterium phage prophiGD43A-4]
MGDMPEQACEMHDVQFNPICGNQATWITRVHLANPIDITCRITVMAFCDGCLERVERIIANDPLPFCGVCGLDSAKEFRKERL